LLARSEVGDEGQLWKEISQEVYKDADKLFKMIGEAYAVLSDPAKVIHMIFLLVKESEFVIKYSLRIQAELGGQERDS